MNFIFGIYLIIIVFVIGIIQGMSSRDEISRHKQVGLSGIDTNTVDNQFYIFLEYFSYDSVFQKSRVKFPLYIIDGQEENNEIGFNEYSLVDLSFEKYIRDNFEIIDYDRYLDEDELTAYVTLYNNSSESYILYRFDKIHDKWYLVEVEYSDEM